MKKITLKILTILLIGFAFNAQGQIDFTKTYNLKNVATGKYLYVANAGLDQLTLVDKAGNENAGLNFTFYDRPDPEPTGVINIVSSVRGILRGAGSGASYRVNATASSVTSTAGDDSDKIWVPTQVSGSNYRFGIGSSGSRYMFYDVNGVGTTLEIVTTPTSGADDNSLWTIEESTITLSNDTFEASSVFISNPVDNEVSINGLTASVNKISIVSLLGQEVLSVDVNGKTSLKLDTSALTSGIYLVNFTGESVSFAKKIVKQ